jgi:hypothetical protein
MGDGRWDMGKTGSGLCEMKTVLRITGFEDFVRRPEF